MDASPGEKVAELREQARETQSDLAKAVGVSQATISRLEASKVVPTEIGVLANSVRHTSC
jgi:DNA-binding XRE family transcriptional regulator